MGCMTCGTGTTSGDLLCSTRCAVEAEAELARNRARLGDLRQRRGGPPCAEARGLMDRNSQLHEALGQVAQLSGVA